MSQYSKYPPETGGGGGGTVTSVGITSAASILGVAGSPVTSSGNITLSLVDQVANTVFSGPTTGAATTPTFRALVPNDIPTLTASKISDFQTTVSANTDVAANTAARHNAVTLGTANGLSLAVQALSLALSSTSTTGALSSTDWNTFNGKQASGSYITALTGEVTASGPGSVAATITTNAVTNTKLAQMPTMTIKGNNTGGTADALDLTASQAAALIGAISTMGAFGATPNANGASISGATLTLQPADATNPGGVSISAQTIAGAKTFKASTLIANDAASVATIGGTSSTAIHQINGGVKVTTRTITASLTVDTTTTDDVILCNQSGAINVTLPTPTNGRRITIKDISGTANTNNITIVRNGSEKIENVAASKILQTNYGSFTVVADGTNWWLT